MIRLRPGRFVETSGIGGMPAPTCGPSLQRHPPDNPARAARPGARTPGGESKPGVPCLRRQPPLPCSLDPSFDPSFDQSGRRPSPRGSPSSCPWSGRRRPGPDDPHGGADDDAGADRPDRPRSSCACARPGPRRPLRATRSASRPPVPSAGRNWRPTPRPAGSPAAKAEPVASIPKGPTAIAITAATTTATTITIIGATIVAITMAMANRAVITARGRTAGHRRRRRRHLHRRRRRRRRSRPRSPPRPRPRHPSRQLRYPACRRRLGPARSATPPRPLPESPPVRAWRSRSTAAAATTPSS